MHTYSLIINNSFADAMNAKTRKSQKDRYQGQKWNMPNVISVEWSLKRKLIFIIIWIGTDQMYAVEYAELNLQHEVL